MMEFQLVNKYLREPGKTFVAIRCQNPYTAYDRVLDGDLMAESDESLIETVKRNVIAEIDPSGTIVKTQAQLEQANQKIAQNESEQNKLAALIKQTEENAKVNQKVIHVLVLNSVMSKNIEYGTTYKELIKLIPLAEVGKNYLPHDLITIEDPEHVEVNGEGKRILVQLNKEFTYNGEPVSAFVTNGSLEQNGTGVAWKFEGKE